MNGKRLLRSFRKWREASVPLALATVVETEGSTYTKPGHRILIAADGKFQGLISGGCLEGDLAEHATGVIASQHPELLTYDMRGENDELFGLGVGCDGVFRVLLQPLDPARDYQPFAALAKCMLGNTAAAAATVIESNAADMPVGATLIIDGRETTEWQIAAQSREVLRRHCFEVLDDGQTHLRIHDDSRSRIKVLYTPVAALPRLLVLGAALDAVPLVEMAVRLGWRVTVLDHRPAYLERGDFRHADRARYVDPDKLAARVKLARFAAVVVMSHHLASDRAYLRQLAGCGIPYVGLIGPAARRDRLLGELGDQAQQLQGRLHAPAGLPIGADSPESIALAVLAEIQRTLAKTIEPTIVQAKS